MIHIIRKSPCQGFRPAKQELIRELLMGFHRCPLIIFSSQMSSLVALTLRNLKKSINFSKGNCFGVVCETQPFPFYEPIYKSSQSTGVQSTMLRVADDLPRALPWVWCGASLRYLGDLAHSSHILALIYPAWPSRASSVLSAEKDAPRCGLDIFCGEILFWKCLSLCWLCRECGQLRA